MGFEGQCALSLSLSLKLTKPVMSPEWMVLIVNRA